MKEITSRKTKKVQFVTEKEWENIVKRGWADRFTKKDMPERKLREVPILEPKPKITKPNTKK